MHLQRRRAARHLLGVTHLGSSLGSRCSFAPCLGYGPETAASETRGIGLTDWDTRRRARRKGVLIG
jgi:hypothetical protein